jgi:hypothetical protein
MRLPCCLCVCVSFPQKFYAKEVYDIALLSVYLP